MTHRLPSELNQHRLLGVNEIATMLGISRSTVYNLLREGKLPRPIKIGNSTRWSWSDIEAFLKKPPA